MAKSPSPKTPASKAPAAKAPAAKTPKSPAKSDGTEASAAGTGADAAVSQPAGTSFLESVRRNRMGALTAALVVALLLGLLLSVLVPSQPGALAMILLGALMTAAVGFTVRYLSVAQGLLTQVVAFVATVIGVHVMSVTGAASGSIPLLEQLGGGPSFDDALLLALATPAISAGGVLAGLVAAIIVGWGPKPVGRIDLD